MSTGKEAANKTPAGLAWRAIEARQRAAHGHAVLRDVRAGKRVYDEMALPYRQDEWWKASKDAGVCTPGGEGGAATCAA